MNRTLLLSLLSRCRKIILEGLQTSGDHNFNTTAAPSSNFPVSTQPAVDPRKSYDNAYFYILFVLGFYSFLAIVLFKNFTRRAPNKDPYEECLGEGGGQEKSNADDLDSSLHYNEDI